MYFTCESGYCGGGGWIRGGQRASILLMGEKHLEMMILLFAEAADVDIWAHLHHRVTCSNFGRHETTMV